jgi:hypothetical protein
MSSSLGLKVYSDSIFLQKFRIYYTKTKNVIILTAVKTSNFASTTLPEISKLSPQLEEFTSHEPKIWAAW